MTSRNRKRCVAGLVAVGMLALSGCSFHPGSAAVVNGSDISQSKVDQLVLAACSYQKGNRIKAGGTTPQTSVANLRQAILQSLISFQIAKDAASQLHLSVSPAAIAKAVGNSHIPPSVSGSDRALLLEFFTDSAKSQLQEAVIGAHLKNHAVTNADHVSPADVAAATKYLAAFTKQQDVSVSPAFGTWTNGALVRSDGSLSVPVSSEALKWEQLRGSNATGVKGLPPSQVCG